MVFVFSRDHIKLVASVLCVSCKVSSYNWIALEVYKVSKLDRFFVDIFAQSHHGSTFTTNLEKICQPNRSRIDVHVIRIQIKFCVIWLFEMHLTREIVSLWDVKSTIKFYVTVLYQNKAVCNRFKEFLEQYTSLKKFHSSCPSNNGVHFCFLTR